MESDDEALEEELQIMEERASEPNVLDTSVFHQPVSVLCDRAAQTLDVGATVRDALELMRQEHIGSVVITRDGGLAGIVTERDFLKDVVGREPELLDRPVGHVMTPDPEWLMPDDEMVYLLNKMHVGGFRHVPIVDEERRPLYVVSVRDVAGFILDLFPEEVVLVSSDPYRGQRRRYGA